jgi:hypothetical protein
MTTYGEPYLGEAVFVGSTGATGTVNYNAEPGDFIIAEPAVEAITITLPAVSAFYPSVAVQPSQAALASGPPYYPTAPKVFGPTVTVAQQAASGAGQVSFVLSAAEATAGTKLNGATGAFDLAVGPSVVGAAVVAIGGNWYAV